MKLVAAFAGFAWLLACDSGSAVDASDDGAALGCDGGCGTTIATFCQSNACPSSPSEAVAALCDAGAAVKVYSECGHIVVIANTVDGGEQLYFDADGGLLVIYDTERLGTCCIAGPANFEPAGLQGCTLTLASCAASTDGGADASDASRD